MTQEDEVTTAPVSDLPKPPSLTSPTPVTRESKVATTPPSDLSKPPSLASPTPAKQESKVTATPLPDLPDPPRLAPSVQHTLLNRGDAMLSLGDVSAARMLYQRAADAGVGVAALKLAETYDPAFLAAHDLRGNQARSGRSGSMVSKSRRRWVKRKP